LAPAPASRDLPALQRPKRRRASVGKVLAAGLASLLALGGIAVVSVPGLSKPIRGLFKSTDLDIIPFEVKLATLPITVNEKGALESSKNQDVQCLVEGQTTIISILPEGTPVKKGDLVCELDSASLKDQLTNQKIATQGAEASYQNARLTREVAQIAVKEYKEGIYLQDKATIQGEMKLAESDLKRAEDRVDWATRMYEKGYVSKAQKVSEELNFQKAKFTLEQSQSKLDVLEKYTKGKTIKELESEVEKSLSDELAKKQTYQLERDKEAKLERQIANCKLLAPGDGIVVYANDPMKSFGSNQPQVEEGATVRERQKIFSLPDITKMQVNAKVHESQIDKIQKGLKARIRVDAFADRELSGTVMDVAPLPDATNFFSSDIKVYTTRIRIDDPLPGLRPGMNAEVEILVDRKEKVLSVPIQAILEYQGKDHMAIKTPNGYERRVVEVGVNNERFVEITKGVTAGTVVALNPVALMTDEERREFQGSKGANKKDWGGLAKGKDAEGAPGAEGAKGSPIAGAGKGVAAATGKPGDPAAKGKAKTKGRTKGAGGGPAFFAKLRNLPPEDRAKMKTASDEEREALYKKAGLTDEEIDQIKQFRANGGGGGGWGGGGGGGGGMGGPPGGGN
jgi:HlyD family secretion protein